MEFLFLSSPPNGQSDTRTQATRDIGSIVGYNQRSIYSKGSIDDTNYYYVFKGPWGGPNNKRLTGQDSLGFPAERLTGNFGTSKIKNYTKSTIYQNENSNNNPYVDLINKFDGKNSSKSLTIKASDLAYLRKLGVYPINRMVVLRRFDNGQLVPEKLDELDSEPISTVIGWLKEDENFGKIEFNETWTQTQKRIDELLGDMIKENFTKGLGINSIMPVPGFAKGLLFGLMRQMGLVGDQDSPWDWNSIPIGDPNVLQEGPYRDPSVQNLKSSMQYSFETIYEQKFIGDVDPGAAMIDIIDNLLKMGTSDMKYWLNNDSKIIQDAKKGYGGEDLNFWWKFVLGVIDNLVTVIADTIKGISFSSIFSEDGLDVLLGFLNSVMTATVAKYRWELKGSLELMTGRDSTTPWYLTIGNPYSPWLATNHIIVDKVEIETSNEVGFNDMPMWLKVTINATQSRNLGRNEIIKMFNNSFLREYSKYGKEPMDGRVQNMNEAESQIDTSDKAGINVGIEKQIEKNKESKKFGDKLSGFDGIETIKKGFGGI